MQKLFTSIFPALLIFGLITGGDNLSFAQEAFDADAATEAYLASIPAEDRAQSDAYFEGGYWLLLWGTLYSVLAAWVLLHFKISARLRDWAEKLTRFKFIHSYAYAVQYIAASFVIGFPWAVYVGFFREHQYGLANQTFGPWFSEQIIGLVVTMVLFSLLIAGLYKLIEKATRTWWIWGAGLVGAFFVFVLVISPVFLDPLFNEYTPMEEGPLRDEILSMARANGVPGDEVYVADESEQSTRISANVSGAFGTTRIALNDNLLENSNLGEIKSVMGHEIAHFVTNIIFVLIIPFSVVILAGFAFVNSTFPKVLKKYGQNWGVRSIADPAGLPLFFALIAVFSLVMTPVTNTIVRENERMADAYGLNAAQEPDGFATIALKLGEYRKLDPGPIEEFIFFDHPSGRSRIQMSMDWKAENLDEDEAASP
ncbi:MAG: M48 family metallopeptidase [Sphingomonadales bacterium]